MTSIVSRQLDNIELTHKLLMSQIDNLIGQLCEKEDLARLKSFEASLGISIEHNIKSLISKT